MKKFFYTLIATVMVAGFSSCKTDDPEFQIPNYGVSFFVLKENTGGYFHYRTVCGFYALYGELASGAITRNGVALPGRENIFQNYFEVVGDINYNLEDVDGSYRATAKSKEEAEAEVSFTITTGDDIGDEFEYSDFEYLNSGMLKMKVTRQVENATEYGFYVVPIYNNQYDQSYLKNSYYRGGYANTTDGQDITYGFYSSSIPTDAVRIYPAAVAYSGTTNGTSVVLLGEGKILLKNGSSFQAN